MFLYELNNAEFIKEIFDKIHIKNTFQTVQRLFSCLFPLFVSLEMKSRELFPRDAVFSLLGSTDPVFTVKQWPFNEKAFPT